MNRDRDVVVVYVLKIVVTESRPGAISSARQHNRLFAPPKPAFAINAAYALHFSVPSES